MLIEISRTDSGVSVLQVFRGDPAEALAKWESRGRYMAVSWREITEAEVPVDHWFREAWEPGQGGPIKINMAKAREIQARHIQAAREREVVVLQGKEGIAHLTGRAADASQHAADRATLETMNLTAVAVSIAGATNPTALKAVWPAKLLPQE